MQPEGCVELELASRAELEVVARLATTHTHVQQNVRRQVRVLTLLIQPFTLKWQARVAPVPKPSLVAWLRKRR
jgi:hypothetical protein